MLRIITFFCIFLIQSVAYADHIFYSIGVVYDQSRNNKYLVFKNQSDYFAVENVDGLKKGDTILVEHIIRYMPECDCVGLINNCEYELSSRILYIFDDGFLIEPGISYSAGD